MDPESIGAIVAQRYVLERVLRHGRAGTVYVARHVRLPRRFAVQIIPRDAIADAARFEQMVARLETVRDAASAGVVDGGELSAGRRYVVRDWPGGAPLRDVEIAAPGVRAVVHALARSLAELHAAGIVHGDLDPRTIVVERDGAGRAHVHVVDLGPGLLAPVDVGDDLLALGAITCELVGGQPFTIDADELRERYDTPRLRAVRPGIDPLVEVLARRLLARSRARRIASAHEACEVLALIADDRAAAAARLGVVPDGADVPDVPDAPDAPPAVVYVPRAFAPPPSLETDAADDAGDDELGPPRSSRARIAIAFAAGMLVLGLGAALVLRSPPSPRTTEIALVQPPPAPAASPPSASPPAATAAASTDDADTGAPPSPPHPRRPDRVQAPRPATAPPDSVAADRSSTAARSIGEASVPVAGDVRRDAATAEVFDRPPTAEELAAHYVAVGQALRDLHQRHGRAATLELWPRYRRIRLHAAIGHVADRVEVTRELARIEHAIAAADLMAP